MEQGKSTDLEEQNDEKPLNEGQSLSNEQEDTNGDKIEATQS